MISAFVISLVLLGVSGLLIDSHRRSWHLAQASTDLSDRDKRYALSQYRRRMQASGSIGLIGAAIGVGPLVPRQPGPMALYVAALASACAWIMLLALLDIWATRQYYHRLRDEHLAAQMRLAVELQSVTKPAEGEP